MIFKQKKYWIVMCIALLINIPLLVLCTYKTDKSVLLKGDTTNINSLVDIDTDYEESGTFSSIYVISFDHSSLLQNIFVDWSKTSVLEPINENYDHFTFNENYQIGQVQKNSSIMTALITAYNAAKDKNPAVHLDYSFKSLCVSYYFKGSPFKIGDEIVAVNGQGVDIGGNSFQTMILDTKPGDRITVLRNSELKDLIVDKNVYNLCRWYPYYTIDYDTTFPKATISKTTVGGPSGGLMQTLSIYNRLVEKDYTNGLNIAGTGTIQADGTVGAIGGIQQKIYTAFDDNMDIFLCPKIHYEEALEAYNKIKYKERMTLVSVETFADAIEYLDHVKKV